MSYRLRVLGPSRPPAGRRLGAAWSRCSRRAAAGRLPAIAACCFLLLLAGTAAPLGVGPEGPGALAPSVARAALEPDVAAPGAGPIRLIVAPAPSEASSSAVAALSDLGVRRTKMLPEFGMWVLEAEAGDGPRVLERLRASGRFAWVEPVVTRRLSYIPDDAYWQWQWGPVAALSDLGVRRTKMLPEFGMWVLEAETGDGPRVLERLRASGRFAWVEPVVTRRLSYIPDDAYWQWQWGPVAVGLPEAWDRETGDAAVTLAVVDTGVNPDIIDFAGRIVAPYSAVEGRAGLEAARDTSGHGTGVSAVAAATGDDAAGIAGAAWGIGLMPVQIARDSAVELDLELDGLAYAVANEVDVINLSFGSVDPSFAEESAVNHALDRGIVVVAAAGNRGFEGGVEYPSAYPGVIAVGSVGSDGSYSGFSGAGRALDLVAPGRDVPTWDFRPGVWEVRGRTGTSFAAPLVSGVAALMLSANPGLGPADVEYILTRTADDLGPPGRDDRYGWGLLDADEALELASRWEPVAFTDVPAYHPYAQAVTPLAAAGVIGGFGDGTFGPEKRVTRQQFAKMVLLALGQEPTTDMVCPFPDVQSSPTGLYPDHYVALAARLEITTGTSVDPPRFDPYGAVTRAQVVTMSVRGLDSLLPGTLRLPSSRYDPPFGSFSSVHDQAATKASWNGMLDGLEGMGPGYDMWAPATRGEVASILAWAQEVRTGLR